MNKKISLIIPIYNGEKFISSLLSVINSFTYKNLEVIFIDNNSTDNSILILKEEIVDFNLDYIILKEENQGAGYARNAGIAVAKGEYIAFLDCDDKIDPIKFENDIKIFKKYNVDFVFCRAIRYYDDGRIVEHPINGIVEGINFSPDLGLIWLNNFFHLQGTGSIVIKKEIVEKLGGFHTLKSGEDAFLFIRLGLKYTGYFVNQTLFSYYRHKNSTVSTLSSSKNGTLLSYFELRKNLLSDSIINDNPKALSLIKRQINMDVLRLHNKGLQLPDLVDEKLQKFKFDFILFNPFSKLINRLVPKINYNPFFQLWVRK